jgi:hypothetical protein
LLDLRLEVGAVVDGERRQTFGSFVQPDGVDPAGRQRHEHERRI